MPSPLFTLTTDFGHNSPYVAQRKGVIFGICPSANVIDITHSIAPQQVREGAIVLRDVTRHFPAGTIHLAVVDPGVGTERGLIYAQMNEQHFIAPDSGLLSLVAREVSVTKIIRLTNRAYWLPNTSHTFHGRDIIVPVAAHLANGLDVALLGAAQPTLIMLDWPEPVVKHNSIDGQVVAIDSFGNILTNIAVSHLAAVMGLHQQRLEIHLGGHVVVGLSRTYGEATAGKLVALIGSNGYLEVAAVNGSAAQRLASVIDDPVTLKWPK